jgi:hypothetical protein
VTMGAPWRTCPGRSTGYGYSCASASGFAPIVAAAAASSPNACPREQGDAGDYRSTPVQWPGSFTSHSNPEKLPYACQTSARPMQR